MAGRPRRCHRARTGCWPRLSVQGQAGYGIPADDPQYRLQPRGHVVQHHPPAPGWRVAVVAVAVGTGQQDDRPEPGQVAVLHVGEADMDLPVSVRSLLERSDQARVGGFVYLPGQGQDRRTARPGDSQHTVVVYRTYAHHRGQSPPWRTSARIRQVPCGASGTWGLARAGPEVGCTTTTSGCEDMRGRRGIIRSLPRKTSSLAAGPPHSVKTSHELGVASPRMSFGDIIWGVTWRVNVAAGIGSGGPERVIRSNW